MLCGRIGLVAAGLVLTGLGGAYEKYFVRGERGVCCGKATIPWECCGKAGIDN